MPKRFIPTLFIGALAIGIAGQASAKDAVSKLDLSSFLAACSTDQVVTELPGLEPGSKVTPKQYCDCVGGKYQENKIGQTEVDLLTKVHKDQLTDEDAAKYPKLEDLLTQSEGYEDACKKSLGLPDVDEEEIPDDEGVPDEDSAPQDNQ